MPLGKEVKGCLGWLCKWYSHQIGDKECPFFIRGNQKLEQFRVGHEDPMDDIIRGNKRHERDVKIQQLKQLLKDSTSDEDGSSSSSSEVKRNTRKRRTKEKKKKKKWKHKSSKSNESFDSGLDLFNVHFSRIKHCGQRTEEDAVRESTRIEMHHLPYNEDVAPGEGMSPSRFSVLEQVSVLLLPIRVSKGSKQNHLQQLQQQIQLWLLMESCSVIQAGVHGQHDGVSLLLPRLECNSAISVHRNLRFLSSSNSPASSSLELKRVFTMLARLILNSQPQVVIHPSEHQSQSAGIT
ncbi:LOW QUALITY PROTEIN: Retinitis pigmentosa 9 protein, partial [Plecturocebus cupreus]